MSEGSLPSRRCGAMLNLHRTGHCTNQRSCHSNLSLCGILWETYSTASSALKRYCVAGLASTGVLHPDAQYSGATST